MKTFIAVLCLLASSSGTSGADADKPDVKVTFVASFPKNEPVTKDHRYNSHVTLSIEEDDGTITPSGWSTRKVWKLGRARGGRGKRNYGHFRFLKDRDKPMLCLAWSNKPIYTSGKRREWKAFCM